MSKSWGPKAKGLLAVCAFVSFACFCGCDRRPAVVVIQRLGSGLRYERWPKVNADPRVIVLVNSRDSRSSDIIIPGDVLWCEVRGKYVVGEKVSATRPAAWMAPEWEKDGFFAIDPSALHPGALSDDELYGGAVRWFDSKERLNEAVKVAR